MRDRFFHWLAARSQHSFAAERFHHNYLQLTHASGESTPGELFVQNMAQRLCLSFRVHPLPAQRWPQFLSADNRQTVQRWADEHALFRHRTLMPLLRWNGLETVLATLFQLAPACCDIVLLTEDPLYQRLFALKPPAGRSFFLHRPLLVILFLDERLPQSPLFPLNINGNRCMLTQVSDRVIQRLGLQVQTLIPHHLFSPHAFRITGLSQTPASWREAAVENFHALLQSPASWGCWDDLAVLFHG
ncbi:hypothetical protein [Pantoea sp. 1.19]|uniref:hypothetical protein n=1 Tax=Pantoea sp. 1.19 TaxID=1925589 RepID=UPI000948BF8D|nr:hypothetical protein [Pantoea sp. 1.19]